MYLIAVYVPEPDKNKVIEAMGEAGGGRIGNYEACAWATLGQGQFRPLDGATPHIGSVGDMEFVPEYKVEMVCREEVVKAVVQAMLAAHPYEEPAHHVLPIMTRLDFE